MRDQYSARFAAALIACKFGDVDRRINSLNFPESVFGEVGEGHVLAQLPKSERRSWTEAEVACWLVEKASEGYEAVTLADGLDFAAKNQTAHVEGPIAFLASVGNDGNVAFVCLESDFCVDSELNVRSRAGDWFSRFRFLLRRIRKV